MIISTNLSVLFRAAVFNKVKKLCTQMQILIITLTISGEVHFSQLVDLSTDCCSICSDVQFSY